ncbi:DUF2514 family protein [Burkholderia pseudomultivorans]|uniref:DUF2514 family protein n=1 Tax=Burkholderia pseudomultivorans TaxID=1207504 RepID=UPI0007557D98|nr:DUF2514 family protein [Burkholderia pseudomultivorans]AOI88961.1 hypothetical protein WS57_09185 [Burkholderia pseudomultivorans]KVC29287.1 hypothetical protein WS56_19620 [Burkholderia pseudomultivorans]KVC34617.1 hypothetical protein WS55_33625 [Burkholderia pseudomultivorans]
MMLADPRFWLAVIVAIVVGSAGGYFKGHRDADQSAVVETQAKRIRDLVAERDESDRIARQQQGNAEDASKKRDLARADAAAAASAADGLRKQVAELIGRVRDSATQAGGQTTGDALDLLADLFGRADARAGDLAKIADERGIAGQQCQADYDALKFADDRLGN